MTSDERAVRCLVSGRVQGVWYRATAEKQALRLGLRGSARNLPDGQVEVIAAGAPGPVAEYCGWLWEGPAGAKVSGVVVSEWTGEVPAGFAVS
ncbi:MAG: acylphosphatase [Candidatus Rariloculaceae bacterium]